MISAINNIYMLIVLQNGKVMMPKLEASFLLKDKDKFRIMISITCGFNKVKAGDLNLN